MRPPASTTQPLELHVADPQFELQRNPGISLAHLRLLEYQLLHFILQLLAQLVLALRVVFELVLSGFLFFLF